MSARTPSPWTACGNYVRGQYLMGDNSSPGLLVATVSGSGDEARENAAVISAAPDLLQALLAFRDAGPNGAMNFAGWHAAYAEAIELAHAAIAKALGEA